MTILIVFYVVVIFFGVRLLFTLPLMVFGQKKTRTAMKKSWQLTKKMQWWPIIWRLFLLAVFVAAVLTAFYLSVWIAAALGFVAWKISSIDFGNC
ncbi:glycerophosphoryl diester phosphodiesterase membrane domain-containing protein [Lactobacillus helveticus]|uniref:glycerophosphoryl diester phosphodiesterase membrane domain-containing protein n=1 Tax=Lactobacillus helveticus TaxID=1587 RepID=UPI003F5632A7